jgi:signal transduction histidine kinase
MDRLLAFGRPLLVAMFAVVASFIFSLWVSHRRLAGIEDEVHAISANAQPSILQLDDARSELEHASIEVDEYVQARSANLSTAPSSREKALFARRRLDRDMDAYAKLPFFPGEEERFQQVRDSLAPVNESMGVVLDRTAARDFAAANAEITGRLRPSIDRADALMVALIDFDNGQAQDRLAAIRTARRLGTTTAVTLGALSLVLSVFASVLALVAMKREATRREMLEAERAKRAAAEEEVRTRDDFLSLAAHELRTPLTSLQLGIQALSRAAPSPSEMLSTTARQARRLSDLVEELVDVSQIHLGHVRLVRSDVDLSALVREVVASRATEVKQARADVEFFGDPSVVGHWDRAQIAHVVANLLANALKFGQGAPIEITVGRHDDTARLVVRDHGIGIPRGRLPFVFDLFDRAAPARNYGGLGIGLYVAGALVTAHGGSIDVESTEGLGSAFTVELPLGEPPAAAAHVP